MSSSTSKRIEAIADLAPNYIFHLLAVARVGFESGYADTYRDSLSPDAVALMNRHKPLLTFAEGKSGDLTGLFIFLPCYFRLDSADAFREYASLLDGGFASGDFQPFYDRYRAEFSTLAAWGEVGDDYFKPLAKLRAEFAELAEVQAGNIDAYIKSVWPTEKAKIKPVADKINAFFDGRDIIEKWETVVGRVFKFDYYHIVLCTAIENGPNANSVGYDRVVFFNDTPFDKMVDFISHEVGTHILFDDVKFVDSLNRFEFADIYAAFECLAKYLNIKILGKTDPAYDLKNFPEKEYIAIYADIAGKNPGLPPGDLLLKGLEHYREQSPDKKGD